MWSTTYAGRVVAAGWLGVVLFAGAGAAATPDAWITTKAKMALLTTDGVPGTAINVDTVAGQVTLHGTVASEAEKRAAETAVRGIEGVKGVRSLIQVVPAARQETVEASDDHVKDRVEKVLAADRKLADVSVRSVHDGVVLLGGEAKTLSDHLHAIEAVARVKGVRRVASEIKSPDTLGDAEIYRERSGGVGEQAAGVGATVSDAWITSATKLALLADKRTPGLDVNVDTANGTVTLFGIVDSEDARRAAEEDARKVAGVKAVRNELQIVPAARQEVVQAKDDEVERRVEDALRADQDLADADIAVDVQNGVARLTGTVESDAQRLRAAVTARTAAGVRAVADDLRVARR